MILCVGLVDVGNDTAVGEAELWPLNSVLLNPKLRKARHKPSRIVMAKLGKGTEVLLHVRHASRRQKLAVNAGNIKPTARQGARLFYRLVSFH